MSGTGVAGEEEEAEAHPRPELAVAYVAPESEAEKTIARVWQRAFGIDAIGVDDNFFDLSGNSLLAIQIVTQISTTFKVDLSMASLLEAPTIGGLARKVDQLQAEAGGGVPALSEEEEMERLLAEIEALSADEAEARLGGDAPADGAPGADAAGGAGA